MDKRQTEAINRPITVPEAYDFEPARREREVRTIPGGKLRVYTILAVSIAVADRPLFTGHPMWLAMLSLGPANRSREIIPTAAWRGVENKLALRVLNGLLAGVGVERNEETVRTVMYPGHAVLHLKCNFAESVFLRHRFPDEPFWRPEEVH